MDEDEIRARLLQHLRQRGGQPLEETALAWNKTRIDVVAMYNGYLCGFEIKSAADDLKRLKAQATRYRRYFRKLYLVAAECHVEPALEILPSYWGVWVVRPHGGAVHIVRKTPPATSPRANRRQRPESLAFLMRKPELIDVLRHGGVEGDLELMTRTMLSKVAADSMSIDELERCVFDTLQSRALR